MKTFLSVLLALSVILVSKPLWACDTTPTLDSTCVVMQVRGKSGVWFDLPTARHLKESDQLRPILESQVGDLEKANAARRAEAEDLARANAERQVAQARLESSLRASQDQAAQATAWYRSPYLWLGLGVVIGGVATYELTK